MNKNVFSLLLNITGEIFISLISRGNMFQKVGPGDTKTPWTESHCICSRYDKVTTSSGFQVRTARRVRYSWKHLREVGWSIKIVSFIHTWAALRCASKNTLRVFTIWVIPARCNQSQKTRRCCRRSKTSPLKILNNCIKQIYGVLLRSVYRI